MLQNKSNLAVFQEQFCWGQISRGERGQSFLEEIFRGQSSKGQFVRGQFSTGEFFEGQFSMKGFSQGEFSGGYNFLFPKYPMTHFLIKLASATFLLNLFISFCVKSKYLSSIRVFPFFSSVFH